MNTKDLSAQIIISIIALGAMYVFLGFEVAVITALGVICGYISYYHINYGDNTK